MFGKVFALPILCAAGFGLINPSAAEAYTYAHIDRLAVTLQRQTAELHREVHLHFRPTPSYKHLDEDVAAMERLARHIHDVAHDGGSIAHLRSDVNELDRLFHHVENLVESMAIRGRLDRHTIAHFSRVMESIDDTLHHLRDDLNHMVHTTPHSGHSGYSGYSGYGGYGGYGMPGRSSGIGVRIPFGDRGGFTLRIPIR